jgi:hypothetical protein
MTATTTKARATKKSRIRKLTLEDIAVLISKMNANMNDRFEATQVAIARTRAQIAELKEETKK